MIDKTAHVNNNFSIIQADDLQKRLGNQFLKHHKQTPAGKQDEMFILKNHEQTVIGAARLEVVDDVYWLRNLFIEPSYRHRTLGSSLIRSMAYVMRQKPTYCFPHQHLENFYQRLAFNLISAESLPESLQQKFQNYLSQDKKILAMQFSLSSSKESSKHAVD